MTDETTETSQDSDGPEVHVPVATAVFSEPEVGRSMAHAKPGDTVTLHTSGAPEHIELPFADGDKATYLGDNLDLNFYVVELANGQTISVRPSLVTLD
jgi:hypothetical protein